jgi:membrane-bound ClpP family serine protease
VARFGDVRLSVVTEGEFVGRGSAIEVTQIHGARVVVEAVAANDAEAS